MVFAQLTSRESLRDTVSCLNAVKSQLYHLGFNHKLSRSTLSDMEALDFIPLKPGCLIIMDRGYIDYAKLYRFEQAHAYYIVRAKKNLKFRRQYSNNIEKGTGVKYDQRGVLTGYYQRKHYSSKLRRIKYHDTEQNRDFVFLTNNFMLSAKSVAELYRSRWRVELFFKWIKQHLHIKKFFGTDQNAVKTQIWIAVCAYLLVAIMRKKLNIERSMYEILQILGITVLQKTPVLQVFSEMEPLGKYTCSSKQLSLFDF